jgi:hypothetical protein
MSLLALLLALTAVAPVWPARIAPDPPIPSIVQSQKWARETLGPDSPAEIDTGHAVPRGLLASQ